MAGIGGGAPQQVRRFTDIPLPGVATGVSHTTLVDSGASFASSMVGTTASMGGRTLVVTSVTGGGTTLTGSAGWAGGADPAAGAYTIQLAAAATFSQISRNTDFFSRFRAKAVADQAGTLFIDQSLDGTTWDNTMSQSVPANTPTVIESICNDLNTRVRFTNNGGVATTVLRLSSSLIAI